MKWNKLTGDSILPHSSLDSSTDEVLVWVKKRYAPHVYIGSYDYEDGGFWTVFSLEHYERSEWEVTHWMPVPSDPLPEPDLNQAIVSDAPWNHRTSTP